MRKLHALFAAALMCAIAVVLCGAPVSAETTCRLAYTAKVQYAPQILVLKKGWLSAPGGKEGMELTHQDSPLIEGCRRLRRDPAPDVRIFLSLSHYCEILSEECRP